jgi:hypothetical protein
MAASVLFTDADGATQLTQLTLADAVAGVNQTPRKLSFQNNGTRALANTSVGFLAVGSNDGVLEAQVAAEAATLSPPYGVTLTLSGAGAGGVWGATGTYGYRVTATNATGETIGSVEATVFVDTTTKTVTVAWTQVPGAMGYKVYRTAAPGTYTSPTLVATIGSGATVSFVDIGSAAAAGAPPADNRTGGWITTLVLSGAGAGGVWGTTGLKYYRVAALDSTGAILAASLEASVNVDVATKTVTVSWVAVPNATTYNVYRSTVTGSYVSPALVGSTATLSLVDTGTATTSGSLTAAASYGVPPASGSFGTAALLTGAVAVGQEVFFWINRLVPSNTPEFGNPRIVLLQVKEN